MRKFKRISLSFIVLFLTISVVGCGSSKKDPKDIIKKALKEVDKVEYLDTQFSVNLEMKFKAGKTKMSMKVGIEGNSAIDFDKQRSMTETTMSFDMYGLSSEIESENFVFADEDDEYYGNYSYNEEDDEWLYDDIDVESVIPAVFDSDTLKDMLDASEVSYVGEGKVNDKKTYVLDLSVSAEDYFDLLSDQIPSEGEASSFIDLLEDMDMELPIQMEFYADGGNIAAFRTDIKDEMEKILKKSKSELSELYGKNTEVEVKKYDIEVSFLDFEKQTIRLPKDAKEACDEYYNDYGWDEDIEEGVENPEGPWTTPKVSVSGVEYTLPTPYKSFADNGYQLSDRAIEGRVLEPEEFEYYVSLIKDGKVLYVTIQNQGDNDQKIEDCTVVEIMYDDVGEDVDKLITDIVLPGGITVGTTVSELDKLYPEFTEKLTSDYYSYVTYTNNKGQYVSLIIYYESDKVTGFNYQVYEEDWDY